MATDPTFASIPKVGAALLGAAETNALVPLQSSVVMTAGASGSKIEEVVVQATKTTLVTTTVAGVVYLFLYDGATYWPFDVIQVLAQTGSSAAVGFRSSTRYANLVLPAGWSLRASQSIAANASMLVVTALGADF